MAETIADTQTQRSHIKTRTKFLAAAAAAGAAAAGYYFYGHKNAKKNRQAATKWADDFRKDVVRQAKEIKNLDKEAMWDIVDGVASAYEGVRNLDRKDVMRAASELKNNWTKLRDELQKQGSAIAKTARKMYSSQMKKGKPRSRKA